MKAQSRTTRNGRPHKPEPELPHASEAERGVLGAILTWPDLLPRIAEIVTPMDFYSHKTRVLFARMVAMNAAGEPALGNLVADRLKSAGEFDDLGGMEFLNGLAGEAQPPDYAIHFAREIRKKAQARRLIEIGERAYTEDPEVLTAKLADSIRVAAGTGRRKLERLTAAELYACSEEQRYLVEDVIPEAQGGLLSARYKSLKTTISIDLAISGATGTPFLGKFNVPQPFPCGIISGECGRTALREMAVRIARSKGFELDDIKGLAISTSLPRLPADLDLVKEFIENDGLKLLILDPSYLMLSDVGDSASNVFRMGGILQMFTGLVQETGCSILLNNHNRKGRGPDVKKYDPPELAEIAMTGFAEWARYWILLAASREWDEEIGRHWLWMRTGGSAGHAGLWAVDAFEGKRTDPEGRKWNVAVSSASEARRDQEREAENRRAERQEQREQEYRRKLAEALQLRPEGETKSKLRELSGLSVNAFAVAMRHLMTEGRVEMCEVKKHTRIEEGYRLK